MVYLRSWIIWAYIAGSMPFWWLGAVTIWLLTLPFDRRRRLLHRYSCLWAAHYLYINPLWSIRVEGLENWPKGACVVTANHQSLGDILAMFGIYRHFKWVSKHSVFKVPFLGWNMYMNDYVPLVRGEKNSIERMMSHCQDHLRRGSPLMIFPEGTRSKDGRMRPFKHGAFTLAVENHVPVVPVVIHGTRDALPKTGFLFKQRAAMSVHILPAIHPDTVQNERDALLQRVRLTMAEELARLRHARPEQVLQPSEEYARGVG